MAQEYSIQKNFSGQWEQGREVAEKLWQITQSVGNNPYLPVHGDPVLSQLDEQELICYFVYTLSSWWEIPVINRINANRRDNNFAILMDINPAPETLYRLSHWEDCPPEIRYKAGLIEMFPSLQSAVADAMYKVLRNGFGHNLFGREPKKIRFDNAFDCPPQLDDANTLLVPPVKLALSMVDSFLPKIVLLLLSSSNENEALGIFKLYMTGRQ